MEESKNFLAKNKNKLKLYIATLSTYRKKLIQVLFFEIFYTIKFSDSYYKIHNNDKQTDSLPCCYYFLREIAKFINKKPISKVIDLGSGTGRIANFLAIYTKAKIVGYEIDTKVLKYAKSKKIINVSFYKKNINLLNFKTLYSDCYIFNVPLQKEKDIKKLIDKISFGRKKIKKKYYLIIVNIDSHLIDIKLSNIFKNYKLINFIEAGNIKTLRVYENK